jgi:hypothetical protein
MMLLVLPGLQTKASAMRTSIVEVLGDYYAISIHTLKSAVTLCTAVNPVFQFLN